MAEKAKPESSAERARRIEVERRTAHRDAAKKALAESIIVHGPVRT